MKHFRALAFLATLTIAFCSARAQDPAAPGGPERVIRDFYAWYVNAVVANKDPFKGSRVELKRYATARLLGEIDRMRKGPDGLDGDYFLDAQDFDKAWAKNIAISNTSVKRNRATADVQLRGTTMPKHDLRVTLVQEQGAWKVDKVQGK